MSWAIATARIRPVDGRPGSRADHEEFHFMATKVLPVLPLRDIVVFPHMAAPLFVGREKSVRALEEVMRGDKQILLAAQMEASEDDPVAERIYRIGTVATVVQLLKLPDGTVRVLVEGGRRARIVKFKENAEFFQAEIEAIEDEGADTPEARAMARAVTEQFEQFSKLSRKTPAEVVQSIVQVGDPSRLADSVAAHLSIKIADKQALLETIATTQRLEKILALIEGEVSVLQVDKRIRNAREAPDGEDAARILSERADEGDPEANWVKPTTAVMILRKSKNASARPSSPRKP
jgi:ATP-dependent Lon protease